MSFPRVVLFEDHQWSRMLPLATSLPVCEIRIGMFSLRERVDRITGLNKGFVLGRDIFNNFYGKDNWVAKGVGTLPGAREIWLSGRLGPAWEVLDLLLGEVSDGVQYAWCDEFGLVAANVEPASSEKLYSSWRQWQTQAGPFSPSTSREPLAWEPCRLFAAWQKIDGPHGQTLLVDGGDEGLACEKLKSQWLAVVDREYPVLNWIWDVVPATETAIADDIKNLAERTITRIPFDLAAPQDTCPVWLQSSQLTTWSSTDFGTKFPGVHVVPDAVGEGLFLASGVRLEPGVLIDASAGPVILDAGVRVMSGSRLEGPLYLGGGCLVKSGARVYKGSSFGVGCRLAGEIGETVGLDFVNKQHDGFIGHAVLGSWVNLGALTTCSDLKNNYGEVRVDLGWGSLETGARFVGLMAGDHVKTAIGTMFNTGTSVGFAANVFGGTMPPKYVNSFAWGGQEGDPVYDVERALATAAIVMERRGCVLTPAYEALFRSIAE